MDANSKIGGKDDPNNVTANGKLLLDVVERQNLTIVNKLNLCKGIITRERITALKIEKSVIDYVIVCEGMKKYLEDMLIDEDIIHVLTKYAGTKGSKKKVLSDHNILYCRFSILYDQLNQQIRKEFFNLKSTEGRKAFLENTSNSEKLSKCFCKIEHFHITQTYFFMS